MWGNGIVLQYPGTENLCDPQDLENTETTLSILAKKSMYCYETESAY